MLVLLMLVCLLLLTVQAFWKKGVVAGLVMGLALLLCAVGGLMPRTRNGPPPISLVFMGLGLIVLFFGIFKYFRKSNVKT
jgi:hypothetical protein